MLIDDTSRQNIAQQNMQWVALSSRPRRAQIYLIGCMLYDIWYMYRKRMQVSSMLSSSVSSRSLLFLDEWGKGTLAADGAGLTAALLKRWALGEPQSTVPKVLLCTHFHEIMQPGVLPR